jgi:hypothetical protein
MKKISIEQVSALFKKDNFNHQLRDDGKIVFQASTEFFRDVDGDASIFVVLGFPYENVVRITALSLFADDQVRSSLSLLEKLNAFNCNSVAGLFCLGEHVYWESSLYVDGSLEQVDAHMHGSLANLIKFLDYYICEPIEPETTNNTVAHDGANLLVDRLEQCFKLDDSEEQLLSSSHSKSQADKATSDIRISMSDNLSEEARKFAEQNLFKVTAYIRKSMLSLPSNLEYRIQHGNDLRNVLEGSCKGPYLVAVDEFGKERRSAKIFLSRRGNLNSYIALSTILSRL